jgi:hypothetical protein
MNKFVIYYLRDWCTEYFKYDNEGITMILILGPVPILSAKMLKKIKKY